MKCISEQNNTQNSTRLPIHLQMTGHSSLVVGVTTAPGFESLLVADPGNPGCVKPMLLSDALDHLDFQLVAVCGDGKQRMSADVLALYHHQISSAAKSEHVPSMGRETQRRWRFTQPWFSQTGATNAIELPPLA